MNYDVFQVMQGMKELPEKERKKANHQKLQRLWVSSTNISQIQGLINNCFQFNSSSNHLLQGKERDRTIKGKTYIKDIDQKDNKINVIF